MKLWLILLAASLFACAGCTAFEDLVLGPDPNANPGFTQAPGTCGAPPPQTVQTQEPPILQAGR